MSDMLNLQIWVADDAIVGFALFCDLILLPMLLKLTLSDRIQQQTQAAG